MHAIIIISVENQTDIESELKRILSDPIKLAVKLYNEKATDDFEATALVCSPEIPDGSGSLTGHHSYPITGWHVWSVQISSTNGTASLWYDGTLLGSVSGKTIPNMPSLFLGGRDSAGSRAWNGCISEKALFNSIIGNTQRQAVEAAFLAAL